ncbi:MAG: hypothetical protein IKI78_02180 [Clostridia bacterium]|nr:hypothetical protein [Clostridia bacterium]
MNEELVKRAHAKDIRVMLWTVNDISLINKYSQWGVDGVITDYPDIMLHKLKML